jgi:hypothetical protein
MFKQGLIVEVVGNGLRGESDIDPNDVEIVEALKVECKPRAPYMVTWTIRQPISPQLHVYKPTSHTSR